MAISESFRNRIPESARKSLISDMLKNTPRALARRFLTCSPTSRLPLKIIELNKNLILAIFKKNQSFTNLMANYAEAIRLPFKDFKKLTIGALLWMIPFVNIITGIFATGYVLTASKSAMKKSYVLPEWKDWGDLFVKGLLAMVIGIIWAIPVLFGLLLFFMSAGVALFTALAQNNFSAVLSIVGASIGSFIMLLLLGLLTSYVSPAAILGYIKTGNFSDAFDFRMVFSKAFRWSWLSSMLFVLVWSVVLTIGITLASLITAFTIIIPLVVQGYLTFIIMVTTYTLLGESYGEK